MIVSRDANNLASEPQNASQHRAIIIIRCANTSAGVCLDRDAAVGRHHMRALGSGRKGPARLCACGVFLWHHRIPLAKLA